jgi:hypothetical protein
MSDLTETLETIAEDLGWIEAAFVALLGGPGPNYRAKVSHTGRSRIRQYG